MKRIKGTYNGSSVVLRDKVDLPPNTEVEVLIPEPQDRGLAQILEEMEKSPVGETMSLDEVAALVHEVRSVV
jgi:hypothetical protein